MRYPRKAKKATAKKSAKRKPRKVQTPKPKHNWEINVNEYEIRATSPGGDSFLFGCDNTDDDTDVSFAIVDDLGNDMIIEIPAEAFKEFLVQLNGFAVAKVA